MKNRYDLIVVGGGFAGVAAAVTAARQGTDVLLIERFNSLGGAASNGLVMPFMKFWSPVPNTETDEKTYLCGNLFLEILKEMDALTDKEHLITRFDEEILKLVLNRMALEAGVQLLFNTVVTEAKVENGAICSVKAWGKSRAMEFFADRFIDATGDAELATIAGVPSQVGREKDGLCQPMTLCFRMSGVDKKLYLENKPKINPLYDEFRRQGKIKNPRENVLIFDNMNDGVLHFNTTRVVKRDPTDPFDVTVAEIEAREQAFEILRFLKENIPGFENARILSSALQIGIRESRKIQGEYTLTVEDLKSLARFEDAIAVANYDIDIHNPEGAGTSHYYFDPGDWYQIPYRCLLPKNLNNLLVAGRCISSTHEAQASYRIMPYCCELGQAAGQAAAMASQGKCNFKEINVPALQEALRKEGFIL